MVKKLNEGLASLNVEETVDISRIRKLAGLVNNSSPAAGKPVAENHELDHEVQMARADLYKIAEYAIKLHKLLENVSEEQGIEGWVQAKITKASDYLDSIYHYLEYDMISSGTAEETVLD